MAVGIDDFHTILLRLFPSFILHRVGEGQRWASSPIISLGIHEGLPKSTELIVIQLVMLQRSPCQSFLNTPHHIVVINFSARPDCDIPSSIEAPKIPW
jgi:hypothetical protein